MIYRRASLAATLLLGAGCTVSLGDDHLKDLAPPFTDVRELCVQAPPKGVTQQTGPSLSLPSGTVFLFGNTVIEKDASVTFLSNTEAVASDPALPCELVYARDSNGQLSVPIALSDDELAADSSRKDGRHTELWPRSAFVADDTGYVFYQKVTLSNYFDVAEEGTGIARFRADEPAERLAAERYAGEPLLTWVAPDAAWGTGTLIGEDGMAYVYGCYERAAFDVGCRIARVKVARVADPDAYTYYDVDGKWSDRVERAAWVLRDAKHLSGFYSSALKRYVLLYSEYLGNRIYAVTAPDPSGPFSEPVVLTTALAPQEFWIDRVDVHPGLGSADGRHFVFGYRTDNPKAPGLHLVEAVVR